MPQSTVQICIEEQRSHYFNALGHKVSEFKKFQELNHQKYDRDDPRYIRDIDSLLRDAISLRYMFDIKSAVVTLTRDDMNLLHRILNTSA